MKQLMEGDPFDILGVSPDASLDQVRAAYRNRVLTCHPDTCPDEAADATRRFTELTAAYKAACRILRREDEAEPQVRVYTPADFSRLGPGLADRLYGPMQWQFQPPVQKRVLATRDENAVFVCFWLLAVVLALGVVLAWSPVRTGLFGAGRWGTGDVVGVIMTSAGVYVGVLIVTVSLLVASRKVVWLIVQFGVRLRRLLPAPARKLPNDQSRL